MLEHLHAGDHVKSPRHLLRERLRRDQPVIDVEPELNRAHHDHFICKSCGDIFEFSSPDIERLQDEAAEEIGFVIQGHKHQIFGLCRRCAAKAGGPRRS